MAEGKAKRDWVRIVLDVFIPVILAITVWAGTLLWSMSKAQVEMHETQKTLTETIKNLSETIKSLQIQVQSHEIWKAETTANRFTVKDGHELWREIADLRQFIASLPLGEPPDWFVNRVDGLAERMDSMEHRMNNNK